MWWISPADFMRPHDSQGFVDFEYHLGNTSLLLKYGNATAGVVVDIDIEEMRNGDNSWVFGIRREGKFEFKGRDEPYVCGWINSTK